MLPRQLTEKNSLRWTTKNDKQNWNNKLMFIIINDKKHDKITQILTKIKN